MAAMSRAQIDLAPLRVGERDFLAHEGPVDPAHEDCGAPELEEPCEAGTQMPGV